MGALVRQAMAGEFLRFDLQKILMSRIHQSARVYGCSRGPTRGPSRRQQLSASRAIWLKDPRRHAALHAALRLNVTPSSVALIAS